ncbi:MAG: Hsp70 family protein [Chloroflexota bacterium]
METIVGIDLGTTNSGVAVVRNGAPQILPHGDERIIPSVVGHSPRGELATVTVRFDFGVDGILKVTARDRHTGQEKRITLDAPLARLSETEILKARFQVTDALAAPGETPSLSAETAALVERAEQLLEHNGLDPSDWKDLSTLLADIREAQKTGDADGLRKLQEVLLDMLFDLEEM